MKRPQPILLSRELRLGLHPESPAPIPNGRNGFAGDPPLTGIAPFLTLTARVYGHPDPATGMLVNIKIVDAALREAAVPLLRAYPLHRSGADLMPRLLAAVNEALLARHAPPLVELELAPSPCYRLAITKEHPAVVQLTQRYEFSAAHRLHALALSPQANIDTFGRCNNPNGHGHNYELEVTVEGTPDPATGVLIAIPEFHRIVNTRVVDAFDHKHLNLDCPEFADLNPTVENIARIIYQRLENAFPPPAALRHVRVWETPKTWAQYGV